MLTDRILLTVEAMSAADRRTIDAGTPGEALMERAGEAVTAAILDRWSPRPTLVLCGPGNNGGDGFVIARHLQEAGWPVSLALLGDVERMQGDASVMVSRWKGDIQPFRQAAVDRAELVVDAVFGAGLSRRLDDDLVSLFDAIEAPLVAVDLPSGVDGNTGELLGGAPQAELTVTFCRKKPGHLLLPGRGRCGDVVVSDIGIADATVDELGGDLLENHPELWVEAWPWPRAGDHKYTRGHLVVTGGGMASSGAARLAARAGLRAGAGLVTCAVPAGAVLVYAARQTAVMTASLGSAEDLPDLLEQRRAGAVVLGPGQGVNDETRRAVEAVLLTGRAAVLDADALTVFHERPGDLFALLNERCVLTPHEGEFKRLFRRTSDKVADVRHAARAAGCVVLLKGADTVMASPDGTTYINSNAPPDLATAGSGDVLAGFTGGFLSQGCSALHAAGMAAWLHGETGREAGPGLIAEDLPEMVPAVLRRMKRTVT